MNDIVNKFLVEKKGSFYAPEMVCADGFKMSVQASGGHYCSPRENYGPYTAVEVLPDKGEEMFDGRYDATGEICGWCPVDVVVAVIEKHGGLVE